MVDVNAYKSYNGPEDVIAAETTFSVILTQEQEIWGF